MNHQITLMYINFHHDSNMSYMYIATPATDTTPITSVTTLIDVYHICITTSMQHLTAVGTNTATLIHTYMCANIL